MRLPVANGNSEEINDAVFCRMIDRYMEQGFVYFDTAYPYHNQKSEEAVRRCLVERYDRERFFLADKMQKIGLVIFWSLFENHFRKV